MRTLTARPWWETRYVKAYITHREYCLQVGLYSAAFVIVFCLGVLVGNYLDQPVPWTTIAPGDGGQCLVWGPNGAPTWRLCP